MLRTTEELYEEEQLYDNNYQEDRDKYDEYEERLEDELEDDIFNGLARCF